MRIREVSVQYLPSDVPLSEGECYRNSRQIFEAFRGLYFEPVEVFRVLFLDGKNRVLFFEDVARGSVSSCVVHPREVFWSAVYHRASAILCVHNHPSGDPEPSGEDETITRRLKEAGELLGIRFLDHVIIGERSYYSFVDHAYQSGRTP